MQARLSSPDALFSRKPDANHGSRRGDGTDRRPFRLGIEPFRSVGGGAKAWKGHEIRRAVVFSTRYRPEIGAVGSRFDPVSN